jgi:hypothetical protein
VHTRKKCNIFDDNELKRRLDENNKRNKIGDEEKYVPEEWERLQCSIYAEHPT